MAVAGESPTAGARTGIDRVPAILVVLVLALCLRVWGLTAQGFTADELTELNMTHLSIGATVTAGDGFPPLYNLLLRGWLDLFGSVEAARWLSLLLGVLAVPATYRFGAVLAGDRVGRWAALLLAVSPVHVWYSQEVRAYALYILLAAVALWRFELARRSDRFQDWAWYVVAAGAGMYTHYYFGFLILALITADVLIHRAPWKRLMVAHGVLALLAAPLLLLLGADLGVQMNWPDRGGPPGLATLGYTFFNFVAGYSLGPSLRELTVLTPGAAVREALLWALPVWVVTVYLFVEGAVDAEWQTAWRRSAVLVVLPIALCGGLAYALDVGYKPRYVVWCIVPFVVLMAIGLTGKGRRAGRLFALFVLLATSAVALVHRRLDERYVNRDVAGGVPGVTR
jgi:4-amino-4-deoxy-L-arabinose transferase-like glycosyltransferase